MCNASRRNHNGQQLSFIGFANEMKWDNMRYRTHFQPGWGFWTDDGECCCIHCHPGSVLYVWRAWRHHGNRETRYSESQQEPSCEQRGRARFNTPRRYCAVARPASGRLGHCQCGPGKEFPSATVAMPERKEEIILPLCSEKSLRMMQEHVSHYNPDTRWKKGKH